MGLLRDGKPAEADHYRAPSGGGGLLFEGHSTWLYDASGRQQFVISQSENTGRTIERDLYDAKGRLYFVDRSQFLPGATTTVWRYWTFRSFFSNGALAHEIVSCGVDVFETLPDYNSDCDGTERRWDACGNLTYLAKPTKNGRYSHWTDWSWTERKPLARHDRWSTLLPGFSSIESYALGGAGRADSGAIVTTNRPNYGSLPPTEQHAATYAYDDAGRTIDRHLDGQTDFHAVFDEAGRLRERTGSQGKLVGRWTYEGCGR
jgi:hypothetical protein